MWLEVSGLILRLPGPSNFPPLWCAKQTSLWPGSGRGWRLAGSVPTSKGHMGLAASGSCSLMGFPFEIWRQSFPHKPWNVKTFKQGWDNAWILLTDQNRTRNFIWTCLTLCGFTLLFYPLCEKENNLDFLFLPSTLIILKYFTSVIVLCQNWIWITISSGGQVLELINEVPS